MDKPEPKVEKTAPKVEPKVEEKPKEEVAPREEQTVHPMPQEDQPHPIYGYDRHEGR